MNAYDLALFEREYQDTPDYLLRLRIAQFERAMASGLDELAALRKQARQHASKLLLRGLRRKELDSTESMQSPSAAMARA